MKLLGCNHYCLVRGLNIFATDASRDAMLHYLDAVCRIAGLLGASRLVFGSPKNRDRTGLTDKET